MQIAVFGATGGTGRQLVRQALTAGHQVTAVARRPDAIRAADRLRVVRADLLHEPDLTAALTEALAGVDAVCSALGTRQGRRPTTIYSAGTAEILSAMRRTGVSRIVVVTAATLLPEAQKTLFERRFVDPVLYRFFGAGYHDMRRMEALLADSDREWTVFRPPRLTEKAGTGRYRTAVDAPLRRASTVSRADLAAAMLAAAGDTTLVHHTISIAN